MVDVDPRVSTALRELAARAPQDADVWPAAERYVTKHRRRRHGIAGAAAVVIVVAGGAVSVAAVHDDASRPSVGSDSSTTTVPPSVLPAAGPVQGSLTILAGPAGLLAYEPARVSATTGIYSVTLEDSADTEHTLRFADAATLASDLVVNASGEKDTTRVFFAHPGDYDFFCVVTGHRIAGMAGVVHVTGPAITLAQAEAAGATSSP